MEVQAAGRCGVGDVNLVLAVHIHGVDHVGVGEVESHLGEGLLGLAVCAPIELVPGCTCAPVTTVRVVALLVARVNVPFLALVTIWGGMVGVCVTCPWVLTYARPRVVRDFLADGAGAGAALQGRPAGELAAQGGAEAVGWGHRVREGLSCRGLQG